jgi:hypothetical protein
LGGGGTVQLDLLGAGRKQGDTPTDPVIRSGPHFASASIQYRPRFAFLKGL